mmetsp:Transcript_58206/g.131871  ORF Transcript_58206/g.131871 Transcript_58206/m.131871 type:complete len:324 (+) Transcript_58206:296-1267(+)
MASPVECLLSSGPELGTLGPEVASPAKGAAQQEAMRILTVGDGNLSYSLALSKHLQRSGIHFKITATTYDTHEDLERKYPASNIAATIEELENEGHSVLHAIDARHLDRHFEGQTYDHIIFMHPLMPAQESAFFLMGHGFHFSVFIANRLMLLRFLKSAIKLFSSEKSAAEPAITITMKDTYPYSWWKIEKLADHVNGLEFLRKEPWVDVGDDYVSRKVEKDEVFKPTESTSWHFGREEGQTEIGSESKPSSCSVCDVICANEADFLAHVQGKKHRKRAQMEAEWEVLLRQEQEAKDERTGVLSKENRGLAGGVGWDRGDSIS